MTRTLSAPAAGGAPGASEIADALREAEELFNAGRPDEARTRLEQLLAVCPATSELRSEVLSDLAVIAVSAGETEEAARLATDALAADPDHPSALEVVEHCAAVRRAEAAAHSRALQSARVDEYRRLWTCVRVRGRPITEQPLLLLGDGQISFGAEVQFGWSASPGFYDRYAYIEAAHRHTQVEIGSGSLFNNGVTIRAEGPGISIGSDCLFGWNVEVLDSDFHDLHPARRRTGTPATGHVAIGNNVFIGANTIVSKGVKIGDDTVVGSGSTVVKSLPGGVVAAGTPARVIREIDA